jgi:hypothetical protein
VSVLEGVFDQLGAHHADRVLVVFGAKHGLHAQADRGPDELGVAPLVRDVERDLEPVEIVHHQVPLQG